MTQSLTNKEKKKLHTVYCLYDSELIVKTKDAKMTFLLS